MGCELNSLLFSTVRARGKLEHTPYAFWLGRRMVVALFCTQTIMTESACGVAKRPLCATCVYERIGLIEASRSGAIDRSLTKCWICSHVSSAFLSLRTLCNSTLLTTSLYFGLQTLLTMPGQ